MNLHDQTSLNFFDNFVKSHGSGVSPSKGEADMYKHFKDNFDNTQPDIENNEEF